MKLVSISNRLFQRTAGIQTGNLASLAAASSRPLCTAAFLTPSLDGRSCLD